MPSALIKNDNVSFICARNFTWNGQDYKMGDDFNQDVALGRIELLVRTRRVIPVVDSTDVKPRLFHREVRLREHVEQKLGVPRSIRTPLDQTEADNETSEVEDTPGSEELGFDPAKHSTEEVLAFVEENPDEVLSVYELEEQGKNRKGLKSKLDDILNKQTETEEEHDND